MSIQIGHSGGSPTGVIAPYSMPDSATASSIGAKEHLRTSRRLRTSRLTSTRVVARARQAAVRSVSPRRPRTMTQLPQVDSSSP